VRILVVEDDPGLNKLAQKRLRDAGFETEGVLTGAEALDRINSDPDLIALVDQQLPDMKGTELITTLITQNLAIPFVAMTGSGDEHIAIEMGCNCTFRVNPS
jgi:CheY-like chemotaxis protein